jgi:hypothetical protein
MALFAIMAAMAKTKKMASLLRSAAPAVAGAVLFAAQPAEAKILEGYVDVYVGGMYGTPPKLNSVVTIKSEPNGTTKGADFFDYNSGGLLGLRGGVEVLHTDVYVQFDQFVNLQGFSGSTVQGMIGWDSRAGLGGVARHDRCLRRTHLRPALSHRIPDRSRADCLVWTGCRGTSGRRVLPQSLLRPQLYRHVWLSLHARRC